MSGAILPGPWPGAVLVTGIAGFIGHATAKALLARGERVIGIDIDDTSPPAQARLADLRGHPDLLIYKGDVADAPFMAELIACHGATRVIHLAARAGVAQGETEAMAYGHANIMGQIAVLEACRRSNATLVYASSSSVYGQAETPSRECDPLDPRSIYAATKAACETLAAVYDRNHGVRATGLRFFSVYGPHGRPDMAPMIFARAILQGEPVRLYGECWRDFTFIDDVVSGIIVALDESARGYQVLNVGAGRPVAVTQLLAELEVALGRKAVRDCVAQRRCDAFATWADTRILQAMGWRPGVTIEDGARRFAQWFTQSKREAA